MGIGLDPGQFILKVNLSHKLEMDQQNPDMKRDILLARDTFDRFVGALQHLEVSADLIQSADHEKSRMAMILLHSLAEGLMFSEAIEKFDYDLYVSRVTPPKYSATYRKKVLRYFDEKVEFCLKELKILSEPDANVFKIINFYRNAAYHRDCHNRNVITPIARNAFHAALRLFERTAGSSGGAFRVSMQGLTDEQAASISRFCDVNGFIDYMKAASEAVSKLSKKVPISPAEIRTALISDIENRLLHLERMKKDSLYCEGINELEELFKRAAFELKGIDKDLSSEIKQLNYRITGQIEGGEPTREEYLLAEQRYSQKLKEALQSFKPKFSIATLDIINEEMHSLRTDAPLEFTLSKYLEIDKLLVEIEIMAFHAERRIDQAIQMQIDLELGK